MTATIRDDVSKIRDRAKLGAEIFENIRRAVRDARIAGIKPKYVKLTPKQTENLVDYFIYNEVYDRLEGGDGLKVMGLTVIVDERTILSV